MCWLPFSPFRQICHVIFHALLLFYGLVCLLRRSIWQIWILLCEIISESFKKYLSEQLLLSSPVVDYLQLFLKSQLFSQSDTLLGLAVNGNWFSGWFYSSYLLLHLLGLILLPLFKQFLILLFSLISFNGLSLSSLLLKMCLSLFIFLSISWFFMFPFTQFSFHF